MQEKKYSDTKKVIRSVLLTYQSGVSLNEFIKTYRGLIGESLPTRSLGFTSDMEFLRSMPDVVHISTNDIGNICLTAIADKASQHIKKLVSRQRKAKKNNKYNRRAHQPSIPSINYKFLPFVPGPVRAEMIQVAKMYPDGISLPSFVLAYVGKFNKYLTLEKGLVTLESMISVISDLEIKTVRNEKKIFFKNIQNTCTLNGVYNTHREHYSSPVIEGDKSQLLDKANNSISIDSSGIPDSVQMNFIKVLETFPEGILTIHFPPLYENVTGQSFDMLGLGYNSILDLIDALPNIFKRVLDPYNSKQWVIFPVSPAIKYPSDGDATKNKKAAAINNREGVPGDAASALLQFEAPSMPKNINLNEFLPIFVSAVVSPGLFWFQLQLDEDIEKFEKLERDIGAFYGSHTSSNYKMHDVDISIGATCIVQCPDDKQWYRAIIKDIPTSDLVNVLFVDYGSRDNVSREALQYARSEFMDFPAHAFRAELAAVRPAGDNAKWNSQSLERFIELCTCASLMAHLIPIDDDVFSVYLCDTSGDIDIHINDTLIKEGYADLCFETQTSKNNSSYELANSESSSGIDSDSSLKNEVYDTLNSDDFQSHDASSDSATDVQELPSFELERQPLPDSSSLPDNRELSFSAENKSFDTEPKACGDPTQYHSRRYIKRIKEHDYILHIINHENILFISAGDVSKLLWRDHNPSSLVQRLMDTEVIIPAVTLSEEHCPELFKQGQWYKLIDMKSNDSSLNLYTLENVLKILNTFGHSSISIKCVIKSEMIKFDPHDSIWHEFSYEDWESVDNDIERENLGSLCLLDLKTKFQALKMKRLKLLKANSGSYTEEIKKIENLQFVIQKRMKYIKALWSKD